LIVVFEVVFTRLASAGRRGVDLCTLGCHAGHGRSPAG
jgi:hypothetical protein